MFQTTNQKRSQFWICILEHSHHNLERWCHISEFCTFWCYDFKRLANPSSLKKKRIAVRGPLVNDIRFHIYWKGWLLDDSPKLKSKKHVVRSLWGRYNWSKWIAKRRWNNKYCGIIIKQIANEATNIEVSFIIIKHLIRYDWWLISLSQDFPLKPAFGWSDSFLDPSRRGMQKTAASWIFPWVADASLTTRNRLISKQRNMSK